MKANMKKLILSCGAFFIGFVILTSVLSPTAKTRETESESETKETVTLSYTIKDVDDRVVVYLNDFEYIRTDTPVSSLPKADRKKLKDGIVFSSYDEMKKLLQDYCS